MKNILLNLAGALTVTALHVAIFGWQGLGITTILAASIFVAFLVMDGMEQIQWRFGNFGGIIFSLTLAVIVSFPISLALDLSRVIEITVLVTSIFAMIGGGVFLLSSRKRRKC